MKKFAWASIIIGLGILIIFIFIPPFNDYSGQPDSSIFSHYGEFVGGLVGALFSLAGFFLIYLTLQAQQDSIKKQDEEIKAQKKAYDTESFESTFFNLLNVQQNITNDIKAYFIKETGITYENYSVSGREFFRIAVLERFRINSALSSNVYVGRYDKTDDQTAMEESESIHIDAQSEYYPFYAEEETVKLHEKYRLRLINRIYGITKEKWEVGHKTEGIDRVNFIYDLFFEKYHYAAGHYFRNLYHIAKYIRQFEVIQRRKNKDKLEEERIIKRCYQYARFIQAQMSSYELALLHDNSLSFPRMLKLVKKYNLVDNCSPEGLIFNINYIE